MNKYNELWKFICKKGSVCFKPTFDEIEEITGYPIDHSFSEYAYSATVVAIE